MPEAACNPPLRTWHTFLSADKYYGGGQAAGQNVKDISGASLQRMHCNGLCAVKTFESLGRVLGGILASESGNDSGSGGLASLPPEATRLLGSLRLILARLEPIRNTESLCLSCRLDLLCIMRAGV